MLDHLDNAQHDPAPQPTVTDIAAFTLIGRNLRVDSTDEYRVVGAAFEDLFSWTEREGIGHDGDGVCVIHAAASDQLHLTIGVRPAADSSGIDLPERTFVVELQGGPTAVALHHGPMQSLPMAHATLTDWVYSRQYRTNGPARETYLGVLDEQRTRIEIPLCAPDPVDPQ